MAGEIFISYRRSDEGRAAQLDALLRARGITPWYDARLRAGADWRSDIAAALEAAPIFVLLYSAGTATSTEIGKELAVATLSRKLIVPVRLEDVLPTGPFLYELASRNWFDVFPNPDLRMAQLADRLAGLARGEDSEADEAAGAFGTPHGLTPHAPERARKPAARRGRRPALVAAAAALTIAVLAAGGWFAWSGWHGAGAQAGPGPAGANAVSIAVLPFANLSADKDQQFFSDGMTDELTTALAKVPGLRVIGRTSAYQFKGAGQDARAIGRALGVKTLLEGTVRREGDKLRITAELIRTEDGSQLWTESYDRELKSVFQVQEDIAVAIARALRAPLKLKDGQTLVADRTDDIQSYQDYLQALALFRARNLEQLVPLLNRILERNPNYAPAWALLAEANTNPAATTDFQTAMAEGRTDDAKRLLRDNYALIDSAARKAISLDPNNAVAYAALGSLEAKQGHWSQSALQYKQALQFDPSNPELLYSYSYMLSAIGDLDGAMKLQERLLAEEPFVPVYRARMADVLWAQGRNDQALAIMRALNNGEGENSVRLAKLYATAGQFRLAADTLTGAKPTSTFSKADIEAAARVLRTAPAKAADPASLPKLPGGLSFVYLFVGADGRALEFPESQIGVGYYGSLFRDPWSPPSAPLRKTERFKAFVRTAGFQKYWRENGWPPFCHAVGANDFACQ